MKAGMIELTLSYDAYAAEAASTCSSRLRFSRLPLKNGILADDVLPETMAAALK